MDIRKPDLLLRMTVGGMVGHSIAGAMKYDGGYGADEYTPIPTVAYHVVLNGQATGPFDTSMLAQIAVTGKLTANSLIWKSGTEQWVKAETVDELKNCLSMCRLPLKWKNKGEQRDD